MKVNLTGQWAGLFLLGIIFILAGVFKWPHPEITWIDRDTEFGEKLNTIIMISLGIILLIVFFAGIIIYVMQNA